MNEQQSANLASNVADWLKGHQYTQLVKTSAIEAWRCKEPGSTNLAFDITITRFGMAAMGDIGNLTFGVGSSYGLEWIANTSLDNLHGKLEPNCKEVWIDKDAILESVRLCICEALEEDEVDYPESISTVAGLIDWLKGEDYAESEYPLEEWLELLERIGRFDEGTDRDVVPALDLIAESETLLRTADTWEWSYTKPTDHVWRKLYYVRHAARQILAQQAAAEEADVPQVEGVDPRTPEEQLSEIVGQLERYGYVKPEVLPLLWAATNLNDDVWHERVLATALGQIDSALAPLRLQQQQAVNAAREANQYFPTPGNLAGLMVDSADACLLQPAPAIEYAYSKTEHSDNWSDDSLASYVSDYELTAGAVIYRGTSLKQDPSYFLPDVDDVINHMANQAHDNSEYADNFPDLTEEQQAEIDSLLDPLRAWVDRNCEVRFYEVNDIEPYTITAEDVAAADAYRAERDRELGMEL